MSKKHDHEQSPRDTCALLPDTCWKAPIGIFRSTFEGRFIAANKAMAEMFGYDNPDQLVSEANSIYEQMLVDSGDKEKFWSLLEKQGEVRNFETRGEKRDGSVIWVSLNVHVVRDEDNSIAFCEGFCTDISVAKERELRHLQSEALLDALSRTQGAIVYVKDMRGRLVRISPTFLEMMNMPESEILGKTSCEIYDSAIGKEHMENDRHVMETGETYVFEETAETPSGKRYFVSSKSPFWDEAGNVAGLIGVAQDITEHKFTQFELQRVTQKLQLALDAANMGWWHYDPQSKVASWDDRYKEIFEVQGFAAPNEEILARIHPEDLPRIWSNVEAALNPVDPQPYATEFRIRLPKGGFRWIEAYGLALFEGEGEARRATDFVGTVADITERKTVEEEMRKAREAAEHANMTKSEFLANMSHEIRTPVNGLMGMIQLMQTTNLDAEQSEYAEMAVQSCKRLVRLMSDILDLSRVEAGMLEIRDEPFDLDAILRSVEQLFAIPAKQKNLDFKVSLDPLAPKVVLGDPGRLQQILNNLVGNAVKFTEKGSITLDTSLLPTSRQGESRLLFTVADTGIGITDDQLEELFNPFTQAEGSYSRRYQGAGLGLSIVKRLIDLMGGSITIDSEPGSGSAFYVSIPFTHPESEDMAARARMAGDDDTTVNYNILLVEDDIINRKVITRVLEKAGWRVGTAGDGRQALQALRDQNFDLVLMDVQLPVMDGIEAAKAIREGVAGADTVDIPIIALTAHAMSGDQQAFLDAGMDGYLAKPVEFKKLEAEVKRVVGDVAG